MWQNWSCHIPFHHTLFLKKQWLTINYFDINIIYPWRKYLSLNRLWTCILNLHTYFPSFWKFSCWVLLCLLSVASPVSNQAPGPKLYCECCRTWHWRWRLKQLSGTRRFYFLQILWTSHLKIDKNKSNFIKLSLMSNMLLILVSIETWSFYPFSYILSLTHLGQS